MYPCRRVEVCDETTPHFVQEPYCERGIDDSELDGAIDVETTECALFTFKKNFTLQISCLDFELSLD